MRYGDQDFALGEQIRHNGVAPASEECDDTGWDSGMFLHKVLMLSLYVMLALTLHAIH